MRTSSNIKELEANDVDIEEVTKMLIDISTRLAKIEQNTENNQSTRDELYIVKAHVDKNSADIKKIESLNRWIWTTVTGLGVSLILVLFSHIPFT